MAFKKTKAAEHKLRSTLQKDFENIISGRIENSQDKREIHDSQSRIDAYNKYLKE